MHVRIRIFGKPDTIVVVESKLTKIEQFRRIIRDKFDVEPKLQRLFYGGKLLEDGYTFHDYNIKINDVIQLMVKLIPEDDHKDENVKYEKDTSLGESSEDKKTFNKYEDAVSSLYAVGDLVDIKDREQGCWLEGKIVRVVINPEARLVTDADNINSCGAKKDSKSSGIDKESNVENEPPSVQKEESPKSKKKGIASYFSNSPRNKKLVVKELNKNSGTRSNSSGIGLLYKIQLDDDKDDSDLYCKEFEIRPRARTVINAKDLKKGQMVMLNYNTDDPHEKGNWYDYKVDEINKFRSSYDLIGTLFLGTDSIPQNDTKVKVHDKIYAIEKAVPLDQRTKEYNLELTKPPEKRTQPLNCKTCRDDEEAPCKECGCCVCLGKEAPELIVLCDECDMGYHMGCLQPALVQLPEGDWYCPECARDPAQVVAPGAKRQPKKRARTTRDWGRGMACVGKTKTCAMPANHFGPIPGIEVGMCWRFRIQLSESGVHRPPVSGIHGRDVEGAYSIVLSGGYEDDVDNGNEFTYTGSGGRDLSGNKRTAEQSCDQTLTRENKALARNCAVAQVSEAGAEAGGAWREGRPVRVVRSYKMLRHFPKYAPREGIRYDGIYKVVKYYPEKGLSGFRVWKYLLRRDDPSPAPWEPGAKHYPIVYPDGYLEAEAEKKALKEKKTKSAKGKKNKRALQESNRSSGSEAESSPPAKKRKPSPGGKTNNKTKTPKKAANKSPKKKVPSMFNVKSPKTKKNSSDDLDKFLSLEERAAIEADALNKKLWDECLEVCHSSGKREFVEHVTQVFLCIICQEVAVNPVTTPCSHNFCLPCLKLAMKCAERQGCPCCRQSLSPLEPQPNGQLRAALRAVMPGYDAGKK